jgi:hypothetical protein
VTSTSSTSSSTAARSATAGLGALAAVVLLLGACADDGDGLAARRAEVARRGAQVMPFDLDATTHTFTATASGGVQEVVADDPDDAEQVELIRRHLAEERERFSEGDFDDPAAIHGHDMDGLAELRSGYPDITITYDDIPGGARLTYATERSQLIRAIHAWFDRQVMDHGDHAREH